MSVAVWWSAYYALVAAVTLGVILGVAKDEMIREHPFLLLGLAVFWPLFVCVFVGIALTEVGKRRSK